MRIPKWVLYGVIPVVVIGAVTLALVLTLGSGNSSPQGAQPAANRQPTTATTTSVPTSRPTTSSTTATSTTTTSPSSPTTTESTVPPLDNLPSWNGDILGFSTATVEELLVAAKMIDPRVQTDLKVRLTPFGKEDGYRCGAVKLDGNDNRAPVIYWCKDDGRFYVQEAAMGYAIGSGRDRAIVLLMQGVGSYLLDLSGKQPINESDTSCAAGAIATRLVDTGKLAITLARDWGAYVSAGVSAYYRGLDGIGKCA